MKNVKKSDVNTKLEPAQRKAGRRTPLAPIQRVKIRWNSSYVMASRFVDLYDFFAEVKPTVTNSPRLRPFEEATCHISADKKSTAGIVLPLAYHLQSNIRAIAVHISADRKLKELLIWAMRT